MMKTFQDWFGVIDLETLGSSPDAPILSLGLTVARYDDTTQTFRKLIDNGLYLKFDLAEQIAKGRRHQERVVKWWYEQSAEARLILRPLPDVDVSLYAIEQHLTNYFEKLGVPIKQVDLYDRNCFDISKLQYLVEEDLGGDVFWNYHNTFDIPTALRFMGFDRYAGVQVKDIPGAVYHNALHDSAVDHLRLYKCFHEAGEV